MLLVGYCYSIRSERRLCEEVELRNQIFEADVVELTILQTHRRTQHLRDPFLTPSAPRNHAQPSLSKDFVNTLSQDRKVPLPVMRLINVKDGEHQKS